MMIYPSLCRYPFRNDWILNSRTRKKANNLTIYYPPPMNSFKVCEVVLHALSHLSFTTTWRRRRPSMTPAPRHRRSKAWPSRGLTWCSGLTSDLCTLIPVPLLPRCGTLVQHVTFPEHEDWLVYLSDRIVVRTIHVNTLIKHLFCTTCWIKLCLWGINSDKVKELYKCQQLANQLIFLIVASF